VIPLGIIASGKALGGPPTITSADPLSFDFSIYQPITVVGTGFNPFTHACYPDGALWPSWSYVSATLMYAYGDIAQQGPGPHELCMENDAGRSAPVTIINTYTKPTIVLDYDPTWSSAGLSAPMPRDQWLDGNTHYFDLTAIDPSGTGPLPLVWLDDNDALAYMCKDEWGNDVTGSYLDGYTQMGARLDMDSWNVVVYPGASGG